MHLGRFGTSFSLGSGLGKSSHLRQSFGRCDLESFLGWAIFWAIFKPLFCPNSFSTNSGQFFCVAICDWRYSACVTFALCFDDQLYIWRWEKGSDRPLPTCRQVSNLNLYLASISKSHQHSPLQIIENIHILIAGKQGSERHPCSVLALQPKVIPPSSQYQHSNADDVNDEWWIFNPK